MKKIAFLTLLIGLTISCKKPIVEPTPEPYITDNLVVYNESNAFLIETTATWCQYCPNGAASLKQEELKYNTERSRVVALSSHTSDALETAVCTKLNAAFPTSGIPNFYVNNTDAGQSIIGPVAAAVSVTPTTVGVAHTHHENTAGDTITVDVKVQFFETINTTSYYVQSYMVISGIDAKEYNIGGTVVDLNQVSTVPWVTTGSGNTPSTWAVTDPTVGVTSGDIYQHDDIPAVEGIADFDWGITLDTINPLGRAYFDGDIFGSQYTPIQIKIWKGALSALQGIDYSYDIVTVIWSERFDGTAGVLYVNSVEGE
jgi:hypothetical protein